MFGLVIHYDSYSGYCFGFLLYSRHACWLDFDWDMGILWTARDWSSFLIGSLNNVEAANCVLLEYST